MDDQLDNDLKKRISEVFENFEDDSADQGWLELRKKFPDKRDRRAFAWIWWGATAALLLLFLGIGLWKYNTNIRPEKLTDHQLKHSKPGNNKNHKEHPGSIDSGSVAGENDLAKTKESIQHATPTTRNNAVNTHNDINNLNQVTAINQTKINRRKAELNNVNQNELAKTNNAAKNPNTAKSPVEALSQVSVDTSAQKQDLAKIADNNKPNNKLQPLQLNTVVTPPVEPAKPVTAVSKLPAKAINSMFANDKTTETPKIDNEKRVRFGVYAATYFNYAKGSNKEINVGAGVTSDIKISKNLKIVTGLTIAQNSLSYTGGSSVIIAQSDLKLSPGALGSSQSSYFGTAASTANVGLVATVKNYDASLVNLDIPLNLKYEFNPQKGDTYILAGVSSGTFINETYTSQYAAQTYFSPSIQQTIGATNTQSFSSFYFAKMLNVAFGVGLPFGKNRLTLEPFLKYPLAGLGSQDIHFGAGGINLKFNFQPSKK
ncbi:MAG TPA: hypothetical protein VGN20_28935 [Mucilaginibacter sp.]|jgi:hypothetical protein